MGENKSILHELYVFSEWKPEPEYLQKPDSIILPENILSLWRSLKFFGPKKSLIDSVTAHKERQQKWHIALGDKGKVLAVLTDNILEIRTKRSEYATIAARTTVARDAYPQWRKLVWSPDCSFIVVAYGNGVISFFDLTASNLFNIPADCSRPGGLECTDNTHAVSEIIFRPLRVKDTKWNWEVLVATFDGKLRGYLVSQTEGYTLHHSFHFPGGVAAASYCEPHATLYVAGVPRAPNKDPSSPVTAGITAWRMLNDEPFYKLSVVSDELEGQLGNERFRFYMPMMFAKKMNLVIRMAVSPGCARLVCAHCDGALSVWRLPALRAERRFRLAEQPQHALRSPLQPLQPHQPALFAPADVNWWSDEEIIVSRFSGAVTVCGIKDMVNILGKKPEFFQGTPKLSCAHDGAFMALECESSVVPARQAQSDESMEVVQADAALEDSKLEVVKELVKWVLFAITDMEAFQPKPKKITVVSRIYRLLGVKSTTPMELYSRKIESGSYTEALALAEAFDLDSDLVYQQQWRKNPVSTDAIQNYLSKVSKKIWAVHQCVDRLPESLQAAQEILHFGLELTNEKILDEINNDVPEDLWKDFDSVTLEDLNAYTSELLRCRHVILFYKERLRLYEAILRCEKSTYSKDEYHRLRSNSIVHSATEIAKESRIEALTCLWPYINPLANKLEVLNNLPETLSPLYYQHLLPTKEPQNWFENKSPIKIQPSEHENDWCKKEIFRPIWTSNWSEDPIPEVEWRDELQCELIKWYDKRAREIEERSGMVSHALALVTIAIEGGAVGSLDVLLEHLRTLDTLLYDINVEDVALAQVERMTLLEVCHLLMSMSTAATYVSDLKKYALPYLRRCAKECVISHLGMYLESISVDDLSYVLLVLQSHKEFNLDVKTRLDFVEKCLFAHTGTEQLDMACDLLDTVLKETDGSISNATLLARCAQLQRLVAGSERLACRGVRVPPCELRRLNQDAAHAHGLLMRVARGHISSAEGPEKLSQHDWEILLKDLLELRTSLFDCITTEQCYEIYVSSLLTSGHAPTIRLAGDVLTVSLTARVRPNAPYRIEYYNSVSLITSAAKEYFNSASSLTDPTLEYAKCCLMLIPEGNKEVAEELDLISALPLLAAFNLTKLPIQVRLCEDRMTLIEECLRSDPNAYLASHKLLKLAKLLRIAGDHEQMREGAVLVAVGEHAVRAGAAGGTAAAAAARRLAVLRHAPAAALLARVARLAHAHASTAERRALLAAALTLAPHDQLEDMLKARLSLELESLKQMGAALRDNKRQEKRWASVEEEFADAVTTPVIEKKELVSPIQSDKKPLLDYLLENFRSKFSIMNSRCSEPLERSVRIHCQEFYRSLYPEHDVSESYYCYDRFSLPDEMDGYSGMSHALLKWFYTQSCLQREYEDEVESKAVLNYAEENIYKDSPQSIACFLRSLHDYPRVETLLGQQHTAAAVSAVLYAALIKCNSAALRDNVYLTKPLKMVYLTLKQKNTNDKHMMVIRQAVEKLCAMGEVDTIRQLGFNVNGTFFNADNEYKRGVIYRMARTGKADHATLACTLASKYQLDAIDVWLEYVKNAKDRLEPETVPPIAYSVEAANRILDSLWPVIRGNKHDVLMDLFGILKNIDEKTMLCSMPLTEHIRLLKKAKAASPDLDYRLLLSDSTPQEFTSQVMSVIKADNVVQIIKYLRTLPPTFKMPVSPNSLYTLWLNKYFFNEGCDKKWIQAWRQCTGFFTKLPKEELVKLVTATCFSSEALDKVPWSTRSLMISQAADYCQQEQENDFKLTKKSLAQHNLQIALADAGGTSEQSWAQIGQELTRWARFLDNFHSSTVQAIIEHSGVKKNELWPEVEMSHGDIELLLPQLALIIMTGNVKPSSFTSLMQCLHVGLEAEQVFEYMLHHLVRYTADLQKLITRVTIYHKEGIKFSDEFLNKTLHKANKYGLPPHKQLGLLTMCQKPKFQDGDDMLKIAKSSVDLFKTEWPDYKYAQTLTEEKLLTVEGRREVFYAFVSRCDTRQRKKALVEVLACWPLTVHEGRSVQCEYLRELLSSDLDPHQSVILIKMLLRRPVLRDEDIKQLVDGVNCDTVMGVMWVLLLNKTASSEKLMYRLMHKYKKAIINGYIAEDFMKEMLDQGMFLKLVSTPLYMPVVNYILNMNVPLEEVPASRYTVAWATAELIKANHIAEAGHLQMLPMGIPASLRTFSQTVQYCNNFMK